VGVFEANRARPARGQPALHPGVHSVPADGSRQTASVTDITNAAHLQASAGALPAKGGAALPRPGRVRSF
jgi:hypothetical protein